MIKLKVLFLLVLLSCSFLLHGAVFTHFPYQYEKAINTLVSFPKAQKVVDEAQQGGAIRIASSRFSVAKSRAMWQPSSRSIILNAKTDFSEGEIIRSILFELHNAISQPTFHRLDNLAYRGRISKEEYVRQTEYIEHQNALKTMTLVDEAIALGYYPSTARWYIYKDFERHFAVQKRAGHSGFIEKMYDYLRSNTPLPLQKC